ncbi:MAG: hypothetical protein KDI10_02055 [Halioglobus sp.]|nr:hypothetical protein [Halioglobus sp.]MCB1707504.1 hypothetical protein [Halioglobus sp.]MCP5122608.1 FAD-dependent oxidoreductase [Pseudomonadales bacterium]MCP5191776.1 FAD-dependent oxidoreductase [Pseudomonadales bacterium]
MTTIKGSSTDIIVAGGGPAGCTVAVGLRKLGYRVALVHSPRPWQTCEGISTRTREGLRGAGLFEAVATVPSASPRNVCWNGESSTANTEHLVLRQHFDAALLADVAAAGAELIPGRVRQLEDTAEGAPCLHLDTPGGKPKILHGRFFVDARGRASPGTGTSQLRGPETVSLLQLRQGPPTAAASGVSSLSDGWAWLATTADGLGFIQFTVTADGSRLPKRGELNRWFEQQLEQLQPIPGVERSGKPLADVIARGSTSIVQGELITSSTLRVGDAAMAVDPLSGNGIFQALSSALIAPAVINTLLQYPEERTLAAQFYRDRVHHTFLRFARMGRDFYRMEKRWPAAQFWRQRQDWPDDEPSHAGLAPTLLAVESRPVVAGDRICGRDVAVTSDQPLGVWHVAGVELAPLLRDLPDSREQRRSLLVSRLAAQCAGDSEKQRVLTAWLRRYQIL